jgi:hypothetical protein
LGNPKEQQTDQENDQGNPELNVPKDRGPPTSLLLQAFSVLCCMVEIIFLPQDAYPNCQLAALKKRIIYERLTVHRGG